MTLEQSTELWELVQIDQMEETIGEFTYHVQILVDEASGYGAAGYLFCHPAGCGHARHATTAEAIASLHRSWIQYFGYPKMVKLDKKELTEVACLRSGRKATEGHGVEIVAVPAESHGQVGQVQRVIGTLKRKMLTHLRA